MHKFVKTITALAVFTVLLGMTLITHGQSFQLQPSGPQPYKYQPNANYLTPNGPISSNPNAEPSNNGSILKDAATNIGGSLVSWIGLKALGYALTLFGYVAGLIGSTLFTFAGLLVEFGLFLNTTILDSEVVQLGWRFCRDLANLGFTIGIVVIAYATMLGFESYGMKNLIKNFVLAAVLVNFSFSLAGLLIDGSNMMTNFFVTASIGGGPSQAMSVDTIHKFSLTLADAFGPQRLLRTADANSGLDAFEAMKNNGGVLAAVLSVFFVALFTTFAALGMLAVGLTTFWRFAHLSGLVVIMPLAILCYAFPNTKKHFSTWWQKFFCQLTYMPVATFSIYLVIMFVQIKAKVGLAAGQISADKIMSSFEKAQNGVSAGSTITALSSMAYPFQTIVDMIIVLTLIFLAITKSQKVGCSAGEMTIGWAEGVRDWAGGRGKYKFSEGQGSLGWAGSKFLSGGKMPDGSRGTRLVNFVSRIPILRRLVPGINNFTAATSRRFGNFETEYKGLGDVQLLNNLRSAEIRINAERMAAAAKVAAERGLFSEIDPTKGLTQEEFAAFIPAAKRYGLDKDILKKMPHLYGKFGWDLTKDDDKKKFDSLMKNDFKPEDIETLNADAFLDPEIVKRFSTAHLEKLPKKHRSAFAATLDRLPNSMGSAEFEIYMAKTFGKAEAADALLPQSLKNPLIVKNLTNAHLKRFSGTDKKEHREAILEALEKKTPVGEYVFADKELADFMKKNFAKGKDIDDIHPDLIRNNRFFGNLNEKHIERMNAEPDENQQEAMLHAISESYKDDADKEKIDRMAKTIVEKKNDWQWSPLAENPATKTIFQEIEAEYRSRHPDEKQQKKVEGNTQEKTKEKGWWEDDSESGGSPVTPKPTPPKSPEGSTYHLTENNKNEKKQKGIDIGSAMDAALRSTKTQPWNAETETRDKFPPLPKIPQSEDNQLDVIPKEMTPDADAIAKAAWSVNAKRKTLYEDLLKQGETPTVLKSAWEQLRNAERAYEKLTGKELVGGLIPYERSGQYQLEENRKLEVSGMTPERAPKTWNEFTEQYGERGEKNSQTKRTNNL